MYYFVYNKQMNNVVFLCKDFYYKQDKLYVMLCYVMLCYVMLCYVMLCYVMLCYVMHNIRVLVYISRIFFVM